MASLPPVCWHVHEGPSTAMNEYFDINVDPTRVNASNDIRPSDLCKARPRRYETRDGDFQPYVLACDALRHSLDQWKQRFEMQVPRSTTPSDEAKFLAFKIRMISDSYQLSRSHRSLGGRVDWLTVDTAGKVESGSLA